MKEQEHKSMWMTPQEGLNLAYPVARAVGAWFTPFIRSGFGTHAFAWYGPAALVLMILAAAFAESPEILWFAGAWILMIIYRRIWGTDRTQISGYDGFPVVATKLPFIKTEGAGRAAEPVLLAAAGWSIQPFSQGLSASFMAGALSLGFVVAVETLLINRRMREMRDAALYQQYLGKQSRSRR